MIDYTCFVDLRAQNMVEDPSANLIDGVPRKHNRRTRGALATAHHPDIVRVGKKTGFHGAILDSCEMTAVKDFSYRT